MARKVEHMNRNIERLLWVALVIIVGATCSHAVGSGGTVLADSAGVKPADFTNQNLAIANTSTTVNLDHPSRKVSISTSNSAATIYVNFHPGEAATTNHLMIEAGKAFVYEGSQISSFTYIGASATGRIIVGGG